jgi:hypothetical protein
VANERAYQRHGQAPASARRAARPSRSTSASL